MALTLTGATVGSPDKACAASGISPVALTLTGATVGSLDKACAASGISPVSLTFTGATGSPDKALAPHPGKP
ncbi:hypothetical protein AAIG33_21680 [Phytobacter ursingii]|uniref:hypothetical protein n=1 Tax=Phytobacter ursingii TaxID=1972431 RepID=UPI000CD2470A|nr:hypothetical protein C2U51_18565 [Enterobacteriaceae bacterium ENNIH1]